MDFIFFQSLKTMCGLVLFQAVPVHKNLGSWEQCMRSNLMLLLFLGDYVWIFIVFRQLFFHIQYGFMLFLGNYSIYRTPWLLKVLHEILSSYIFHFLELCRWIHLQLQTTLVYLAVNPQQMPLSSGWSAVAFLCACISVFEVAGSELFDFLE